MLKTSKWGDFVDAHHAFDHAPHPTLSPEERHRLATAPLPAITRFTPTRTAHATGHHFRHEDEAGYGYTKGEK